MSEDWVHGKLKPKACDMAFILRGEAVIKLLEIRLLCLSFGYKKM